MFKRLYSCEFCGEMKFFKNDEEAEKEVCHCEHQPLVHSEKNRMTKEEIKARYKKQYELNGYSWKGYAPSMYLGSLPEWPDRTSEF